MLSQPPDQWPDVALFVGDQVYADDSSPKAAERIEARRKADPSIAQPPDDVVADFEEYTWLYREAWAGSLERWFFSVVPTAMLFDDHDMIDDWNISDLWVDEIRSEPWWQEHIIGGLVSYWVYQHLGNLSPDEIEQEGMLADLVAVDDATETLRRWAFGSEEFTPVPRRLPVQSLPRGRRGPPRRDRLAQRARARSGRSSNGRQRRVGVGRGAGASSM